MKPAETMPLPAWLVILAVMGAVFWALRLSRVDADWYLRLHRPAWLSFERWIPLIWLGIYACWYASALLCWEASRSWGLMVGYAGLLLVLVGRTWLIGYTRRLLCGVVLGVVGWVLAVTLVDAVGIDAAVSGWLLFPYLLWSPVETVVYWQMRGLNS
ncbi:tryptophan-rich sensory protein [Cyanobium sp. ATX 6F1]|uniref:tryptophan-rich sensory protein n=1 Tax=unclassified Cyanobium TaxID=2627006 RepID=UPI0020CEB94F|nr:tryptophan-rich sensory protein [Cyanobium sp. ATX 6F1]